MSLNHSYTKELENLILDTLLPAYVKYQKALGVINPLQGINENILREVKKTKKLPALLRATEKQS